MLTQNMALPLPIIGGDVDTWGSEIITGLNLIDAQLKGSVTSVKIVPFEAISGLNSSGSGPLIQPGGVANVITVVPFHQSRFLSLTKIVFEVSLVGDPGKFAYCGVYKMTGQRMAYAKFSVSVPRVVATMSTDVSALLAPGVYYAAIASDSIIATGATAQNFWDTGLLNLIGCTAANPISGGAMPATLGALTPGIFGTMPSFGLLSQ